MQLQFFPSRQIALYLARLFLTRTFAVLMMFVLVLQTLDLLGESGKILAVPGNGQGDVLHYITLRAPQIISFFLPFSVLLGTLITFTTLSQNSEIVSMKAAGLSAHQILAPLIVASLSVALISFVFNDAIVAPASGKLKRWQDVEYGVVPKDSGIKLNVWVREGQDLINADEVRGTGAKTALSGVSVYLRNKGGLRQVVHSDRATFKNGVWQLEKARVFDVMLASGQQHFETLDVGRGIAPERFQNVKIDGDAIGFFPLYRAIDDLKQAGRRTDALEGILWHKLSGPLSALLMPLLGAVAAFGLARSGAQFVRVIIGAALGFAYFIADNFALAMGDLGAYPPWIAAWAPFLLFFLIGETVLIRTEE